MLIDRHVLNKQPKGEECPARLRGQGLTKGSSLAVAFLAIFGF